MVSCNTFVRARTKRHSRATRTPSCQAMSSQPGKLEASSAALAKKVIKDLKNPSWNVPNTITLVHSSELLLGRCPGKNKGGNKATLVLHSQKLPSMLSRRHALMKYDTQLKQWTVTDLKVYKVEVLYTPYL